MSLHHVVESYLEDMFEECHAEAVLTLTPRGYSDSEIEAAAVRWFEEKKMSILIDSSRK